MSSLSVRQKEWIREQGQVLCMRKPFDHPEMPKTIQATTSSHKRLWNHIEKVYFMFPCETQVRCAGHLSIQHDENAPHPWLPFFLDLHGKTAQDNIAWAQETR